MNTRVSSITLALLLVINSVVIAETTTMFVREDDESSEITLYLEEGVVDDDHRAGDGGHLPDAAEVARDLALHAAEARDHLLGVLVDRAVLLHALELFETTEATADHREVGQGSAQPTLVHIPHAASVGFSLNDLLGLTFGAYK